MAARVGAACALLLLAISNCASYHFTVEPSDVTVKNGSVTLLQCSVSPSTGLIKWRHGISASSDEGHVLNLQFDNSRKQMEDGSLEIDTTDLSVLGNYQCVASYGDDGRAVSRIATVSIPNLPMFEAEPRDLSAFLGESAFFECALGGTYAVTSLKSLGPRMHPVDPRNLNVKVQWLKNEAPLHFDETRMLLVPSGGLEIESINRQDQGSYRCNVSVIGSSVYRLSRKAQLHIKPDTIPLEVITPPKFIAEPRSQTVTEGSSVTMDCASIGNPKPDITWLYNGSKIDLSDLDSRFTLYGSGALYIRSIKESDAGTYQCRADNKEDSLDASADLTVQVPPRFLKEPSDEIALVQQDLEFKCEVYGKPEPTVYWLKNGELIIPNNHDIVFVNGYNLRIQGLLTQDSGIFQCVAVNSAGNIQTSAKLTVLNSVQSNLIDKETLPTLNSKHQYYADDSTAAHSGAKADFHPTFDRNNANKTKKLPFSLDIFNSLKSSNVDDHIPFDESFSVELTSFPPVRFDTNNYSLLTNPLGSHTNADFEESDIFRGFDEDIEDKDERNLPSSPTNLTAVIVKPRFVALSWQEPQITNGDIETYSILYKVVGAMRERMINTTRKGIHEINVSQLQPNKNYQFRVIAYNSNGRGPSSQVLEITTQSEDQSLGPPLNVNITVINPMIVSVSWDPPIPIPGAKISVDKYQLIWTEMASGIEKSALSIEPHHKITNLRPFTEYAVRVVAVAVGIDSSDNAGAPTDQFMFKTPGDVPSAAPTDVKLSPHSPTSLLVQWEAPPSHTRNGYITGYKLKYRTAGHKASSVSTAADAREIVLNDLKRLTQYQVRICAFNINGSGPFTDWYTAETLQNNLDESRVPDEPSPITGRAGANSIFVSWSAPKNQNIRIRDYILTWGIGIPDTYDKTLTESTRHFTIKNLEPSSEYVISLKASNQVGQGVPVYTTVRTLDKTDEIEVDESEEGDPDPLGEHVPNLNTSPPLIPPVGLKADILSSTTAVVYWSDTTLPKSQIVTDKRYYTIRYSAIGTRRHRYLNATNLNGMINDLRPNTMYEFSVKVVKGNRESQWSMFVNNSTLEAQPTSYPRDLKVSVPSDSPPNSVNLHWLPPEKANGIITGYVVLYTSDPSRIDREWIVQAVIGGGTSAIIRPLQPVTQYYFKVQARNSKGYGPFSPRVSFTTPPGDEIVDSDPPAGPKNIFQNQNVLYMIGGGMVIVLLVIILIVIVICCKRSTQPPTSPDSRSKITYQKSSTANIKPPDLWIHHDQMELKQTDKCHHSSSGSGDGGSCVSAMTLPRPPPPRDSCEYETAMPGGGSIHSHAATGSLDKRHYVPTYVAMSSINAHNIGSGMSDTLGSGLRSVYPRTQYGSRNHSTIDQNTPLLSATGSSMSGTLPSQSSMSSLGQMGTTLPLHHSIAGSMGISPISCSQASYTISAAGSILPSAPSPSPSPASEGFPSDAREREQGHYVAYEALHPPKDTLDSSSTLGSLGRPHAAIHPLKSFSVPAPPPNEAPHTPLHHNKVSVTIRPTNTSPYKKPLIPPQSIPTTGIALNRLQQGISVPHTSEEAEALAPSHSTERLHQEMANLEGLMKDLNAITASQFEC